MHSLSVYYVPDTVLASGDTAMNKTENSLLS